MSVLEAMVGWLAPPACVACGREGASLCATCRVTEIIPHGSRCFRCSVLIDDFQTCEKCRKLKTPRCAWITTSYEGAAKELIQKYKFGQQRAASKSLADLMVETFLSSNTEDEIRAFDYLVVPIPTATSRVRERGFDHSALLARHIASALSLEHQKILGRLGQSRQMGARRSERLSQLNGSYYLRPSKQLIRGRNILLVDDVVTTGATLSAASKVLRAAGAKRVDSLIFAKKL